MAAPQFVPDRTARADKLYTSPPRRPGGWRAIRPGEVVDDGQPRGAALGNQGPDQGFALKLAHRELDNVHLSAHEHPEDVVAAVTAVAARRASLFGRAPTIHDVRLAYEVFGFNETAPAPDLVEWRRHAFAGLSHTAAHYFEARQVAAGVPEALLRGSVADAADARHTDWKAVVGQ
ncbi:MAG: hypothetical protein OEW42_17285 [Acidimicrobiia bacterium]|nr:hypothetical protein [Acidimicrobiia bacterium]